VIGIQRGRGGFYASQIIFHDIIKKDIWIIVGLISIEMLYKMPVWYFI